VNVNVTVDDDEYTYELPIPGRTSHLVVSIDDAGYIIIEDSKRWLSVNYVGPTDGGHAVHIASSLFM
jgi:hypothetical protein